MISPVVGFPISQQYGANPDFYAALGYAGHHGIDYACPEGTPVRAAAAGVVIVAEDVPDSTAGCFIHIVHDAHLETRYLHLSGVLVGLWDNVEAGQIIGYSGNTGLSDGPHLHFEVIDSAQAQNGYKGRVNPLAFLEQEGNKMQSIIDSLNKAWALLSEIQQHPEATQAIIDLAEEVKQQCVVEIKKAIGIP